MGQDRGALRGNKKGGKDKGDKEKKDLPPPVPTQIGKKRRLKGPDASSKLPLVTPHTRFVSLVFYCRSSRRDIDISCRA